MDDLHRVPLVGESVKGLDEVDFASEASERLCELAADGPRSDDGETPGKLGQREDGFVGEISGVLQPRNRGRRRPRPGRDRGFLELKRSISRGPFHHDRVPGGEARASV
jgi:hypothetical protein